jgi:glycosyltransferase involved in cell wall biosynthesis
MVIADTPREFADAVLKVLADPRAAQRLGHHGRNWVAEKHSWNRSASLVADAYLRLIGSDEKTMLRARQYSSS